MHSIASFLFLRFFLISLSLHSFRALSQTEWAIPLEGGGFSSDIGFSLTTDNSGNVYSVGQFSDSVDLDPGSGELMQVSIGGTDMYIQKLDANGNLLWGHSLGSFGSDAGKAITIDDTGNVYITGAFGGTVDFDPGAGIYELTSNGSFDIFILKLDNNGNFIWAQSFGGTAWDVPNEIVLDNLGNLYSVGYFSGSVSELIDFDPTSGVENLSCQGSSDIYIQKLDVNGNFIWAKSIGGSDNDRAYDVTLDNSNNPIITGYFSSTVDFDPNMGVTTLTSNGARDICIAKLDVNGNLLWAKAMGSSGVDGGFSIVNDSQNNICVGGFFEETVDFDPNGGVDNHSSFGEFDIFVLQLSENGDLNWINSYGSLYEDYARAITLDNSDNIYLTGHFSSSVDFGLTSGNLVSAGFTDIFVQKIDPLGNSMLANSFGGNSDDHGVSISLDGVGNIYTTGYFQGTADFDASGGMLELSSLDFQEVFIMKSSLLDFLEVDELKKLQKVHVYPNPSNGEFTISLDDIHPTEPVRIEVITEIGQKVWERDIEDQHTFVDLGDKVAGVYFIRIISEDGVSVHQLLIQ
ncbi:MAG: T9SS type A sorting domain-containing protein [Crocinitomicaceae bacterium]